MGAEARATEDKMRRAMMDASKLADELRMEQVLNFIPAFKRFVCKALIKLRQLGLPNRIVVLDLNSESKFDCPFWSDSYSNNKIVSAIPVLI